MEPDSSFRRVSIYVTDDAETEARALATIHFAISESFGVSQTCHYTRCEPHIVYRLSTDTYDWDVMYVHIGIFLRETHHKLWRSTHERCADLTAPTV